MNNTLNYTFRSARNGAQDLTSPARSAGAPRSSPGGFSFSTFEGGVSGPPFDFNNSDKGASLGAVAPTAA